MPNVPSVTAKMNCTPKGMSDKVEKTELFGRSAFGVPWRTDEPDTTYPMVLSGSRGSDVDSGEERFGCCIRCEYAAVIYAVDNSSRTEAAVAVASILAPSSGQY